MSVALEKVKERPIIFSAPMVRAILTGHKTQTRRVVKPQPPVGFTPWGGCNDGVQFWIANADTHWRNGLPPRPDPTCLDNRHFWTRSPYASGLRLWVREAWHLWGPPERQFVDYRATCPDADDFNWRSPIFMPRTASRINLEVVAVRVERLQDISEEDAIAEGIERGLSPNGTDMGYRGYPHDSFHCLKARLSYSLLWDSINGKAHPWDSNPWVWVVEFRKAP